MPAVRYEKDWNEVDIVSNGINFIPEIKNGILSWTNNAKLDNPHSLKISNNTLISTAKKNDFPSSGESYALYISNNNGSLCYWDKKDSTYKETYTGETTIEIREDGEPLEVFSPADIDALYTKYYG